MLCYRDMTFCSAKECESKYCRRKLTEEVQDKALKVGLPLCLSDFSKVCKEYVVTK